MEYRINYGAIREWLEANPGQSRKSVLDCLGKKDFNKMNKICDGEIAWDMEDMVRFLNASGMPLALMFFNEDDDPRANMPFRHSAPADMSMPKGGFPEKDPSMTGPRRVSPVVEKKIQSNLPSRLAGAEQQGRVETPHPIHHEQPDMQTQILNTLRHIDCNVALLAEDKHYIGMAAEDPQR